MKNLLGNGNVSMKTSDEDGFYRTPSTTVLPATLATQPCTPRLRSARRQLACAHLACRARLQPADDVIGDGREVMLWL